MTDGLGRVLLLMGVAALVVGGSFVWPLATEEEPVVYEDGLGDKSTVKLARGESYSRVFVVSDRYIKGVIIFSPNQERIAGGIRVRIWSDSRLVAEGNSFRQVNRGESSRLIIPMQPFALPERTEVSLEVTRISGEPVMFEVAEVSGSLSMSLLHPALVDFGTRQGALVGAIVLVGVALISILPSNRWLVAALLLIIAVPLALTGFLFSTGVMGLSDWDYFMSVHEAYRRSLFVYHDFPLWNPFTCGGTAGLADPEFSMLSPLYLLELFGGVSLGLRLAVLTSVVVGGLGVLSLGKRLGLTQYAALLAALAWSLGSTTILHFVEGHMGWLAAMWVPWVFWAWLAAYRTSAQDSATKSIRRPSLSATATPGRSTRLRVRNSWALVTGVFLALIFYQGGIHILLYLMPALLIVGLLVSNRKLGLRVTWLAGWWALGLAAVKLVPVLLWVRQFPDRVYAASTPILSYWYEVFLGRHEHGVQVLPDQGGGWHEYGAYLGPIIIALALLALARWRDSRVVRGLVLGSGLTLAVSLWGTYLTPMFDSLPWLPRSYTSRVVILTVLGVSLLAGFGLDIIKRWGGRDRTDWLRLLIIGLVVVDLASLAYPLSEQAFVLPEVFDKLPSASTPIAFTRERHVVRVGDKEYDRAYAVAQQGYGTLSYCSALGPEAAVVMVGEQDSEYVLLVEGSGDVELQSWSPNRVVVAARVKSDSLVVINTNYAWGWLVNGRPVVDAKGRVGARVLAGERELVFIYRAPGFWFGLAVTVLTVLIAGSRWRRERRVNLRPGRGGSRGRGSGK